MTHLPDNQKPELLPTLFNASFAQIAEDLEPILHRWIVPPQSIVEFHKDDSKFFRVAPIPVQTIEEFMKSRWGRGEEFIVDFGIHVVGYIDMQIEAYGINIDAPCRLRMTFGESPYDVTESMDEVKTWISTSWLPDEVINVDTLPTRFTLPRRYSFRYLRIQVVDTSPKYKIGFSNLVASAVSSVDPDSNVQNLQTSDFRLQVIDHASISTLRDCMQSVFEDGPRRDRRLWIGDLRLQALVNYCTFKNYNAVKRNLYMFAAVAREDGSLPACLFHEPTLAPASDYIVDYDVLYAVTVCEYVEASGDLETGRQLWQTVQNCLKKGLAHLHPETSAIDSSLSKHWKFLDWEDQLDTSAGLHGVLLFTLKAVNRLASRLSVLPQPYTEVVKQMTEGSRAFYCEEKGVFVSGPDQQVSLASAAWLALAEAFSIEVSKKALLTAMADPASIKPRTPYLWHHVCEALALVGCYQEAVDLIKTYWGGMIEAGADTFWECFVDNDSRASPYGDVRNNSFCHAWSCTPSYILRTRLSTFVNADLTQTVKIQDMDKRWIALSYPPR